MAEKDKQSSSSGSGRSATAVQDQPGIVEDAQGIPRPEGDAPPPEPVTQPAVSAVDLRPRLEPKDRATYLGPVNARDDQVEVPDDFHLFAGSDGDRDQETVELKGKAVEVFQVVASNGALALRVDGDTFIFNPEQTRALMRDVHGASTNVVT